MSKFEEAYLRMLQLNERLLHGANRARSFRWKVDADGNIDYYDELEREVVFCELDEIEVAAARFEGWLRWQSNLGKPAVWPSVVLDLRRRNMELTHMMKREIKRMRANDRPVRSLDDAWIDEQTYWDDYYAPREDNVNAEASYLERQYQRMRPEEQARIPSPQRLAKRLLGGLRLAKPRSKAEILFGSAS